MFINLFRFFHDSALFLLCFLRILLLLQPDCLFVCHIKYQTQLFATLHEAHTSNLPVHAIGIIIATVFFLLFFASYIRFPTNCDLYHICSNLAWVNCKQVQWTWENKQIVQCTHTHPKLLLTRIKCIAHIKYTTNLSLSFICTPHSSRNSWEILRYKLNWSVNEKGNFFSLWHGFGYIHLSWWLLIKPIDQNWHCHDVVSFMAIVNDFDSRMSWHNVSNKTIVHSIRFLFYFLNEYAVFVFLSSTLEIFGAK